MLSPADTRFEFLVANEGGVVFVPFAIRFDGAIIVIAAFIEESLVDRVTVDVVVAFFVLHQVGVQYL